MSFVRHQFQLGEPEQVDDLREMAVTNVGEALGPHAADGMNALIDDAIGFSEPKVAVDGRMLPHEWLATPDGVMKVDALEHHADDFWPGCRDVAWDVAGTIVEFNLQPSEVDWFVSSYARSSHDLTIRKRLPLYEAAYLAYRVGYTGLCAATLGDPVEAAAFTRLADRYHRLLAVRLQCDDRTSPRSRLPGELPADAGNQPAFPESTSTSHG